MLLLPYIPAPQVGHLTIPLVQTVHQQIIVLLHKPIIVSGAMYLFRPASAVGDLAAINRIFQYPAGSKLLTFCTAICWFCPLMWIAKRRSAEDLELSCDGLDMIFNGNTGSVRFSSCTLYTGADCNISSGG